MQEDFKTAIHMVGMLPLHFCQLTRRCPELSQIRFNQDITTGSDQEILAMKRTYLNSCVQAIWNTESIEFKWTSTSPTRLKEWLSQSRYPHPSSSLSESPNLTTRLYKKRHRHQSSWLDRLRAWKQHHQPWWQQRRPWQPILRVQLIDLLPRSLTQSTTR